MQIWAGHNNNFTCTNPPSNMDAEEKILKEKWISIITSLREKINQLDSSSKMISKRYLRLKIELSGIFKTKKYCVHKNSNELDFLIESLKKLNVAYNFIKYSHILEMFIVDKVEKDICLGYIEKIS